MISFVHDILYDIIYDLISYMLAYTYENINKSNMIL